MAYRDSSIVYDHKYLIKHIFHIFFSPVCFLGLSLGLGLGILIRVGLGLGLLNDMEY